MSKMSIDCSGNEGKGVAVLLMTGFDYRQRLIRRSQGRRHLVLHFYRRRRAARLTYQPIGRNRWLPNNRFATRLPIRSSRHWRKVSRLASALNRDQEHPNDRQIYRRETVYWHHQFPHLVGNRSYPGRSDGVS